jgi:hypothetical protein
VFVVYLFKSQICSGTPLFVQLWVQLYLYVKLLLSCLLDYFVLACLAKNIMTERCSLADNLKVVLHIDIVGPKIVQKEESRYIFGFQRARRQTQSLKFSIL